MATRAKAVRKAARRVVRSLGYRLRGWPDPWRLERAGMSVGEDVFIGVGCHLDPEFCFLITIEDEATLSLNVTVLAHDASTRKQLGYGRLGAVRIGARAFIGAGSVILPGVTIGERAIVAAGSVVRHDVLPDTLVAGVPARPIADHAAFLELHRQAIPHARRYERRGWTVSTGITPARVEELRARVREGVVYIK